MKTRFSILAILALLAIPAISQSPQPGGTDYTATSITFPLLNPPQQIDEGRVSVQLLDNPGVGVYCYWIVSNFPAGNGSPAGPVCVFNGPNTLVNGIRVSWSGINGATSYDVLRTSNMATPAGACACAIATGVTTLTATDTGLNAYTVNTFNPATAAVVLTNPTGNLNVNSGLSTTGVASFPGGICYKFENLKATIVVSTSCGYVTWSLALADCPSTGCTLDGTPLDVPLALGAFDTGSNTKPVTVKLGPYNFTSTQITVRQGLDLGGAGILNTNIASVGTNAQPLFVIPQVNNNSITVKIHDFTANGLAGNTSQDGMFFDCSTLTNAGAEFSRFDNLIFSGFNGNGLHYKATQDGVSGSIGCFQGNTLVNVHSTRPNGATGATQNALRIEGGTGQIEFWNSWFLGTTNDTGTNVFVGTTGGQAPYSIHFHGTTNQNGGAAYLLDGCNGCTTDYDHFESIKGLYNFLDTATPVNGFKSTNAFINSNAAVNAGNGYIANIPVGAPFIDALIESPFIGGQPDNCIKNASNSGTARLLNAQYGNLNTPTNVCTSSGVTFLGTPAATLDIHEAHTVQLSASATSITTLRSTLQPGESVTFYTTGGTAQFATGGNISLGANVSPLVVGAGDSVTFMRVDAGASAFVLSAYSRVPGILSGGTAAALTGTGACATFSTQTGGAMSGRATCTAATAASTLTITPGTTATNGWVCQVQDQTTRANLLQQTSTTTTACTLTATSVTQNDVFVFTAEPF